MLTLAPLHTVLSLCFDGAHHDTQTQLACVQCVRLVRLRDALSAACVPDCCSERLLHRAPDSIHIDGGDKASTYRNAARL